MIYDLSELDSTVKNGIHSVTEKKIVEDFVNPEGFSKVFSVKCVKHGACLCVAKTDKGKIWRCQVCNEGALQR